MKIPGLILFLLGSGLLLATAQNKHSPGSGFPSYEGRVLAGYQAWFRAEGDGTGRGWVHYGVNGKFNPDNLHIDLWPEVGEYPQTYPTAFQHSNGTTARVFSSADASAMDVHFRWMKEYGIDGAFIQRFFGVTRSERSRSQGRQIVERALAASQKHQRALAIMYDLSGLNASGEDCSSIIQDWKEMVDQLKLTSQGTNQTYLYHHGKPLVVIWGLGFGDRPYKLREIGIEKVIGFLKNDPEYGGCSVMLGVPTHFRELKADCVNDPYLHELMQSADIILPWMVGRYTPLDENAMRRHGAQIKADLAWCTERKLDYVPCVYPGFSWHHLSKTEFGGGRPLGQIPRQQGRFYWNQINSAIASGAKMLYVAMFDEMDEGTAIFKCTNEPPAGAKFLDYEGMPSDHYLWLTGEGGRLLRGEIKAPSGLPVRSGIKGEALGEIKK